MPTNALAAFPRFGNPGDEGHGRNMTKKYFAMSIFKISALAFVTVGALCQNSTRAASSRLSFFDQQPTRVMPGQMTVTEKIHSRLFDQDGGRDLDEATKEGGRDIDLFQSRGLPVVSPTPTTPEQEISNDTCRADATIIGDPQKRTSQLNQSRRWVLSEYQILVSQVTKKQYSKRYSAAIHDYVGPFRRFDSTQRAQGNRDNSRRLTCTR